jgi:hypothetical protein
MIARRGIAGHVDELGIIRGVDVIARHIDDHRGAFPQAFCGRHRASFIPKKEHDRTDEEGETDDRSDKRPPDPAKDGLTGYFGD